MALHYASDKGDVDVVEALLNHGADINAVTKVIQLVYFTMHHRGRKGGEGGLKPPPPNFKSRGLSPPLICTQDYVHEAL